MTHWIMVHDGDHTRRINTALISDYANNHAGAPGTEMNIVDWNHELEIIESPEEIDKLIRVAEHERPNGGCAAVGEDA